MQAASTQPVLRCRICNKPFDKDTSLRRHGYYCKPGGDPGASRSRPRSCIPCAKIKAKCDNSRPACARCAAKGKACDYPSVRSTRARQDVMSTRHTNEDSEPAVVSVQPQETQTDGMVDDSLVSPEINLEDSELHSIDWSITDLSLIDFLGEPQTSNIHAQPLLPLHSIAPAAPTQLVRTLVPRPGLLTGAQRISDLILHTLKSYPLAMIRDETLPPFIHPQMLSQGLDSDIEPLTNCISLMAMIGHGPRQSRKLFWTNVGLECERFAKQYVQMSKWQLLTAMQALTIYVLVRLADGETDENNVDAIMVQAVIVIAQHLTSIDAVHGSTTQCVQCGRGSATSWMDWIFKETRRRVAIIYRIVNMGFFFEPAALCDMPADLVLAPLPCHGRVWSASDEVIWRVERSQRGPFTSGHDKATADISFGLAADGQVVRLAEGRLSCNDAWLPPKGVSGAGSDRSSGIGNAPGWQEWCAGMDALGGLVLLAGALVT